MDDGRLVVLCSCAFSQAIGSPFSRRAGDSRCVSAQKTRCCAARMACECMDGWVGENPILSFERRRGRDLDYSEAPGGRHFGFARFGEPAVCALFDRSLFLEGVESDGFVAVLSRSRCRRCVPLAARCVPGDCGRADDHGPYTSPAVSGWTGTRPGRPCPSTWPFRSA